MSIFKQFAQHVNTKANQMAEHKLYVVNISKDELWQAYLSSFPEGTNEIFRERPSHDCQCCKQFISRIGKCVAIINGEIHTVWDVEGPDFYQIVADKMSALIKSKPIYEPFYTNESRAGLQNTIEYLDDGKQINWDHFYFDIPNQYIKPSHRTVVGKEMSAKQVLGRGLEELTLDALNTTLDLINSNSIYKGQEFLTAVTAFKTLKEQYDTAPNKEIFVWSSLTAQAAQIRNTAIGTLLQDLSEDMPLNDAVARFEKVVAPENYKRTSAPITQGMIDKALKWVDEKGIRDSFQRRHSTIEDISVNNVLFVDRSIKPKMKDSLDSLLTPTAPSKPKDFSKVQSITIDDFIKNVIPTAHTIEAQFENKHTNKLFSLISPAIPTAPNILKWDNNFTWTYNGGLTDSGMKQRVKAAGGNVDGDFRCSIQWNEGGRDNQDLDLHCKEPNGNHIYYSAKRGTSLQLDIDVQSPGVRIAVENIFGYARNMKNGQYEFWVHNYSGRNHEGFRAQIEINGEVHEYDYPTSVTRDVKIATVTFNNGQFTIQHHLDASTSSKTEWGIQTQQFHKVQSMMLSPNYWDNNEAGNKHFFFILDQCQNPEPIRGLYNEYLSNEMTEHRKVFDMLGSKLQVQPSNSQLSGLGFSSTLRDELIVKVTGTSNRMFKIQF